MTDDHLYDRIATHKRLVKLRTDRHAPRKAACDDFLPRPDRQAEARAVRSSLKPGAAALLRAVGHSLACVACWDPDLLFAQDADGLLF
jgi:hypothetical protein